MLCNVSMCSADVRLSKGIIYCFAHLSQQCLRNKWMWTLASSIWSQVASCYTNYFTQSRYISEFRISSSYVRSLCACLAHIWGTLAVLQSECTSNNNTALSKKPQTCGSFITLATSVKTWEQAAGSGREFRNWGDVRVIIFFSTAHKVQITRRGAIQSASALVFPGKLQ